jgi:hypothetical protein
MNLHSTKVIPWAVSVSLPGVQPDAVHFGQGAQPIQIAVAQSQAAPSRATLKTLFQDRKGKLPVFVIIAVSHGDSVSIFGPDPDSETIVLKKSTAEAVLNSILDQEDEISAYQRAIFLWRSKQTTDMVGFTNNGLFASHFIRTSINKHVQWDQAQKRSTEIQHLRDKELISGLGFEISASPSSTLLLSAGGQDKRVVAILLDRSENFEAKSTRLQASPVEWSLGIAAQQGAPWVIAVKDSQLRLYPAKDGVGVGQKSQAETYFEIDLLTVDDEKVGLLDLIFSAAALAEGGTAEGLLNDSKKFASELGVRLRERVYEQVVPPLATEIANQLRTKGNDLDSKGLQLSYELTLRVLFRLLFQAYAEDRGLLPAGRNEIFDSNSMKHWAQHLLNRDPSISFGDSSTIWFDLMQVWDAIDQGNPEMQIPAYNGGLFGSDPDLHPTGSLIRTLSIPDRVMGPALRALVVDEVTEDGVPGAVDFRSLSVREFGTIYEGLLESSLSVADQDLTVDSKGAWVPAKDKDQVFAQANEVYFHSASGERKATGSYYTPSFIVDHLIERSVEPALRDHLARVKELIDSGDQAAAYKLFFDFRVADLAMGSAHFLVAAIDKIESIMRSFLVQPGNNIEGVNAELIRLEEAAKTALGKDEAAYAEIERASLLRRQIARRCIYGLDINPLAVELSRLAIWIHTFVPGLPMSSLEHNLVCANSLTGIGSVDEGLNALIPERAKGQSTLFDGIVEQSLAAAKALLEEVASADEADKKQAIEGAEAAKKAREAAAKSKMIFDLAVANRVGAISSNSAMTEEELIELSQLEGFDELIEELQPAQMPYLFPEVFLKETPGFDVLVGNPPWEKLVIERTRFWSSKVPGLRSIPVQLRDAKIAELEKLRPQLYKEYLSRQESLGKVRAVLQSQFPLGVGDADLYKAFGWVALGLLTERGGRLGFVLPKTAFSAAGMQDWRRELQIRGSLIDLVYLVNTGRWVFDIEARYSIALVVYQKGVVEHLRVSGPIHSRRDFDDKNRMAGVEIDRDILLEFTDSASIPAVSDQKTANVLSKMRLSPSLREFDDGRLRAVREFDATVDREHFDHGLEGSGLKVLSGRSFSHWKPETGDVFAWADKKTVLAELERKMISQLRLRSSAFFGLSLESDFMGKHPIHRPRIAFRRLTNPTNTRTFIPALIPPETVLTNIAPYFLSRVGSEKLEALLLGVTSSLVFDWYARKFVETDINFHLLNAFPIPKIAVPALEEEIVLIAGTLAAVDDRYEAWAKSVGVKAGSIANESERERLIARLDGLVAAAYGLDRSHLEHIFNTFHRGWSDPERLDLSLQALEEFS